MTTQSLSRADLVARAMYFNHLRSKRTGEVYQQPDQNLSTVWNSRTRKTVVLRNINGLVASYRVDAKNRFYRLNAA